MNRSKRYWDARSGCRGTGWKPRSASTRLLRTTPCTSSTTVCTREVEREREKGESRNESLESRSPCAASSQILEPEHEIRNLKPETRNPKPETRNDQGQGARSATRWRMTQARVSTLISRSKKAPANHPQITNFGLCVCVCVCVCVSPPSPPPPTKPPNPKLSGARGEFRYAMEDDAGALVECRV